MRDYGKMTPQFWIGETGRKLRGCMEAQIVASYLVTGPSAHPLGIYYLPIPTIAHDTGISSVGVTKGLRRAVEAGFASYDEASCFVWVPEMARIQVAEKMKPGDNRLVWAIGELLRIKILHFVAYFIEKYGDAWQLENCAKWPELARVIEGASKAHRSQEQEQEQEEASGVSTAPSDALLGSEAAGKNTAGARVASIVPDEGGFDEFYTAYPKKKAPEKALKAWRKLGADDALQAEILAAIERQKRWPEWRKDGGRFIPYPATWLNGRMWQDEPSEALGGEPLTGSMAAVARMAQRRLGEAVNS